MEFVSNNKLADYVTMRVGGKAKKIAIAKTEQDVIDIANYAKQHNLPLIAMGWGSNIIFDDEDFEGVVLINKINGIKIDESNGTVIVSSGVSLDEVVEKSVAVNLVGIEALSNIPGTIGAAPVNNVGAYGQEISDVIVKIKAYDTKEERFVDIPKTDCNFNYRDSIFKSGQYGRYIITELTLHLKKYNPQDYKAPDYPSLLAELTKLNLDKPTPKDVRQVIFDLRGKRLPDPTKLANTGSFFKNPLVKKSDFEKLATQYPDMPHYPQPDGTEKLSAAWLIETAGLKGYSLNGFKVYDNHALVLVNESSNSFKDMVAISDHIIKKVNELFGVALEIEPEVINNARARHQ